MFDRTFFKFALGLAVIIAASVGALYLSGRANSAPSEIQTASAR
jgi:hypothetical protein